MSKYVYHICQIILFLGVSLDGFTQDKVLFSIEDEDVYLSEFKYIYEKNNRDKADYSEQSLNEYLDLYINFKLKVHKAKELGYDKSESYKAELEGYRQQLADSYIIDKEVLMKMAQEVYDRQQYDVELQHLFVSAPAKSSIDDIEKAKFTITEIKSKIAGGDLPWDKAIALHSQDRSSAKYGGSIGFINAPLPEGFVALEDVAYRLDVGQISQPIQTKNGFHILKVISKRPARGKMEAKHLLIRKERNGIPLANIYPRIKKIYDDIISGSRTFEEATVISSEDTDTKGNEGYLGLFGIGQYDTDFEDAAFALQEDGAISEPVETSVGWHIIKRVSKRPLDDISIIQERMKNAPREGERFGRARADVVASIKREALYKEDKNLLDTYVNTLDQEYYGYRWTPAATQEGTLMSYGPDKYNLNDFASYLKQNSKVRMRDKGKRSIQTSVYDLFEEYAVDRAIAYAEERLEDRYPDFKNLMREYREGILLFDIAKDQIWDKAAKDTSAIEKYFSENREDYVWKDRFRLTQYTVRSIIPAQITQIMNTAKTADTPKAVQKVYNQNSEDVLYKEETLEADHRTLKGLTLIKGHVNAPKFNNKLKVTTFTKVEEVIPARAKTLNEAKGYVISDYQDQLDQEWIDQLRKEYTVKVNQKRLKGLYR